MLFSHFLRKGLTNEHVGCILLPSDEPHGYNPKYAGQEVKKVGNGMTKAELISFLEVLAQLIEAKTGSKEAAEIVRSAKPKE